MYTTSSCAKSLHSCPTLCDPVGCSPPGYSVHGILQARILEWVAMPSSRGSSRPRDQTCVTPALAGRFFTTSVPWEDPHYILSTYLFSNRKFETFGHLCPIFPSSGNHKSDLFSSMSLSVSQAQLSCNTMLVPGAHHSDSIFLYISK